MQQPIQALTSMYERLKTVGTAKLVKQPAGPGGMQKFTLTYWANNDLPIAFPLDSSAEFEISYDESKIDWSTKGRLFGFVPVSNDPKMFFTQVRHELFQRRGVRLAFFERAAFMAEQYRGDLSQFCYKLGLDLASNGTMEQTAEGWHWFSNIGHFDVWFSKPKDTQFGYEPENLFGFFEPRATHQWKLTSPVLMKVRDQINQSTDRMQDFCSTLSSMV